MKILTFSKEEHICKRNEFKQLIQQGKSFYQFPFRCVYLVFPSDELEIKLGISISKKNIKLAIHRNYIKRIIRESYRLNKHLLYSTYEKQPIKILLLLIYIDKKQPSYSTVELSVKSLLNKIIKIDFRNQIKNTNINDD